MPKFSIVQKKWLLSIHIGFAALWLGTVLSMFLLSVRNIGSNDAKVLNTLNSAINLLDDWIVIPAAIGSVVTATLLCWGTNYGFTKFYWVIVKWILTTSSIALGTFWLFPWGNAAEMLSSEEGLKALSNPVYEFDAWGVLLGTLAQVFCLLIIIIISVLKPWGRRLTKEKNPATAK
jgi:hypothetical protein